MSFSLRILSVFFMVHPFSATTLPTIQFCNQDPLVSSLFCIAATSYFNFTDNPPKHDLYMTLEVLRPLQRKQGWSAVGLGDQMAGSLMFILYGDPSLGGSPTLSIRTTDGHSLPAVVDSEPMVDTFDPKPSIEVLETKWIPNMLPWPAGAGDANSTTGARVSFVCYSCIQWNGTSIDIFAKMQPWIWARNSDQNFGEDYSPTALLKAHLPRRESGHFFADMSVIADAEGGAGGGLAARVPVVDWTLGNRYTAVEKYELIGNETTEDAAPWSAKTEASYTRREHLWLAHGFLMMTAFWIVLPTGRVAVETSWRRAWLTSATSHFIAQSLGVVMIFSSGILAMYLDDAHGNTDMHRIVGYACLLLALGQSGTGILKRRTILPAVLSDFCSDMYDLIGRLLLFGGWLNIIVGLWAIEAHNIWIYMALVVTVGLIAMLAFVWYMTRGKERIRLPTQGPGYHMVHSGDSDDVEE